MSAIAGAVKRFLGACLRQAPATEAPAALPGLKVLLSESAEIGILCCRKVRIVEVASLVSASVEAEAELVLRAESSEDLAAETAQAQGWLLPVGAPAEERADCEAECVALLGEGYCRNES